MVKITYKYEDGTPEGYETVGIFKSVYQFEVEHVGFQEKIEVIQVNYLTN